MSANPFKTLESLLGLPAMQVGEVVAFSDGLATVELPGGARIQARGTATVGQNVFIQGQAILGEAPTLPIEVIEI